MSFAFLLIDNNRSKAYLQNFVRHGYIPGKVIVLGEEKDIPKSNSKMICSAPDIADTYFNQNESVFTTLRTHNIPYTAIPTADANDLKVISAVAGLSEENVIYSGPGGNILREEILSQGKYFFHSHSGIVPSYKGSTTFYYSMLLEKKIGCSIMIMSAGLDAGDVVFSKEYAVPKMPVDYDMVVDPLVRTQAFILLMKAVSGNLQNAKPLAQTGEGNMFYIIHPVLKHLAILKAGKTADGSKQ